jgi:hypothetical protein
VFVDANEKATALWLTFKHKQKSFNAVFILRTKTPRLFLQPLGITMQLKGLNLFVVLVVVSFILCGSLFREFRNEKPTTSVSNTWPLYCVK